MSRPRSDFRAVHSEADKLEPHLAIAVRRALVKLREPISINSLALALAARNVKAATAMLTKVQLEAVLAPAGTIVRDAFVKGGKLGAEQVNEVVG